MLLLSQIIVALAIVSALASVGGCIFSGGMFANPADSSWSGWKQWSWYMKLGWVSVGLWMTGMILATIAKGVV
jgi:hypothetical protein